MLSVSLLPTLLAFFTARRTLAATCAAPKDASPSDFAAIQFDYVVIGLQPPTQHRDSRADVVSLQAEELLVSRCLRGMSR